MKTLTSLLKLGSFAFILSACGAKLGSGESSEFLILSGQTGAVTFETLKASFIEAKCASCHAWSLNEEEVKKRIEPGSPETSSFYTLMENGQMPVGGTPISPAQLKLTREYIISLAAPAPQPTEPIITFEDIKTTILVPKCLACHRWADNEQKVAFRIVPGEPDMSSLYLSVESGRMPMRSAPLSADELKKIKDYIESL